MSFKFKVPVLDWAQESKQSFDHFQVLQDSLKYFYEKYQSCDDLESRNHLNLAHFLFQSQLKVHY